MSLKILFVDDEENILRTFSRSLKQRYNVHTALGPQAGLDKVKKEGPFAVVISDLKMPQMDGVTFLSLVKKMSPDTVRVMLTGYGDLETAMSAVNKGAVFRFLTKPCPPKTLLETLNAAIKQYRLIVAEKELLRGTLKGSVKVLAEIIALANPDAFGRSDRTKDLVVKIAAGMGEKAIWKYELAGILSQIGCVSLPKHLVRKKVSGRKLSEEECKVFGMHPEIAAGFLGHIPRMNEVAEIVRLQDRVHEADAPVGSKILRLALDYDGFVQSGSSPEQALANLRKTELFDKEMLNVLEHLVCKERVMARIKIGITDLKAGHILAEDVRNKEGNPLVLKDQEITPSILDKLQQFGGILGVREPLVVREEVVEGDKSPEKDETAEQDLPDNTPDNTTAKIDADTKLKQPD